MIIVIFTFTKGQNRPTGADSEAESVSDGARTGSADNSQAGWETCLKLQGKHMKAVKLNGGRSSPAVRVIVSLQSIKRPCCHLLWSNIPPELLVAVLG